MPLVVSHESSAKSGGWKACRPVVNVIWPPKWTNADHEKHDLNNLYNTQVNLI